MIPSVRVMVLFFFKFLTIWQGYIFWSVLKSNVRGETDWKTNSDLINRLHLAKIGKMPDFTFHEPWTSWRSQARRVRAGNRLKARKVVHKNTSKVADRTAVIEISLFTANYGILLIRVNRSPISKNPLSAVIIVSWLSTLTTLRVIQIFHAVNMIFRHFWYRSDRYFFNKIGRSSNVNDKSQ